MNIEDLRARVKGHPLTGECPDLECLVCGVRDCPHGEPLHYHHDGCPTCYTIAHELLSELSAAEIAEALQGYLCMAMQRWNTENKLSRPLDLLPWERLDPVSRAIYVERCAEFLKDYRVVKRT